MRCCKRVGINCNAEVVRAMINVVHKRFVPSRVILPKRISVRCNWVTELAPRLGSQVLQCSIDSPGRIKTIREQLALLAFKPYRRHRCSQWWWRWSPAKLVVLCKWHSPRRQLQTQTACFVIMQCFEMTQKIAPV